MKLIPVADIRLRGRFVPAVVATLLVLQLITPFRGWWVLLLGLGGLWLISYVWSRSLLQGLRLERNMDVDCGEVGDVVREQFILHNRSWLPALMVELQDHSTLPGYQASRAMTQYGRRSTQWRTRQVCSRRGVFTIGPTTLQTSDPFGLYTVTLHYQSQKTIIVMPPTVPLPLLEEVIGERGGNGRTRDRSLERSVSAVSVREYQPTDSLRWIHWRTSARRDALFVRLFDSNPGRRYWILIDADESVQVGDGSDSTDEHAVVLAASLAEQGLQLGHAVGLGALGKRLVWLPPREGVAQRWELFSALAQLSRGSYPLQRLLERAQTRFRAQAGLIVLTPAVGDGKWIESLVPLLQRGTACTVLLLDPASFGGDGSSGQIEALLPELGVVHHVITQDLLGELAGWKPDARGPGSNAQLGQAYSVSDQQAAAVK